MDEHSYDDIINLPNPTSKNHPRMSLHDRAAQFAPFAALTGHDAAIKETARLTDERLELTDGHTVWKDDKQRIIDLHCFEFTDDGIVYEGDIFPSKTFSGIGKVGDITVSCIEPLSQVMLHLGYEHDKNDVHDVMLLCETFQIAIPDEYKEK